MKVQDIVIKQGEYTNNGVTKARWLTIGRLVTDDNGKQSVFIDCTPVGNWDGSARVFDRKQRAA